MPRGREIRALTLPQAKVPTLGLRLACGHSFAQGGRQVAGKSAALARFLLARLMALVDVNQLAHQKNEGNNNARNNDGPADVGHRQAPRMTSNALIFAERYPAMIGFAVTGFLKAPASARRSCYAPSPACCARLARSTHSCAMCS